MPVRYSKTQMDHEVPGGLWKVLATVVTKCEHSRKNCLMTWDSVREACTAACCRWN